MKRADHSMIFVFIAGTYTPIAVLALPPPTRHRECWSWCGPAPPAASLLKMFLHRTRPRWLGVPFYLALGWVAVFVMPGPAGRGGVAVLVLIALGGLLYTFGAIFYAIRKPDPWPATFGYHEFFHAAVTLAAVVPLRRDLAARLCIRTTASNRPLAPAGVGHRQRLTSVAAEQPLRSNV